MRVLIVAPGFDFSVEDVRRGWVDGLREAGAQVAEYNLTERMIFYSQVLLDRGDGPVAALDDAGAHRLAVNGLLSACYQVQPDVLFVVSGFFLPYDMLDLIRARGTRIVLLHTEEPYEHLTDLDRAVHADVNIVNDPTHLAAFQTVGPAWYQPHSYRPDLHRPEWVSPEYRSEFCFVGTGYPSRIGFLEQVDFTGIDVALAGNWQSTDETSPLRKYLTHDLDCCIDNTETVLLYRGADVSANLYRREAHREDLVAGWAMGPREVELAATGTFFLRDPRPESDEILFMLPSFTDPLDFTEQLRWWLTHPLQREDAAKAARRAVADRTFVNAARRLLTHLS